MSTKTGDLDDPVIMDSSYMASFMPEVLEALSQGRGDDLVFGFSYPAFCREFKSVLLALGLIKTGIVPYSWRHSGPSIDRALGVRSALDTSKRGRWKNPRSTGRYEKAGRLGAGLRNLSPSFLDHAKICEARLADIVLGRGTVDRFASTATS